MTPIKVSIAAAIASLFLLVVVFALIRRRSLRERYALVWLATGIVLLVLALALRNGHHSCVTNCLTGFRR